MIVKILCLPSTICNLKRVTHLDLIGCSKITNLPENIWNIKSLMCLSLGGTAIKELPSSFIHLELLYLSFKGCQLPSSSWSYMPRSGMIDLSDCNLSTIPRGIDRISTGIFVLFLSGNDFVSLPKSISQFSALTRLYLVAKAFDHYQIFPQQFIWYV